MPRFAIRRILVAVKDPAAKGSIAVAKAAELALAFDAELELFHDIDLPLFAEAYDGGERTLGDETANIRADYLHGLELLATPLRKRGLAVAVAAEWDFPAFEAVLRRAYRSKADLIVTAHRRPQQRSPWPLHATDWELLRRSPVPVLLVKSPRPYRRPVVLAAIDPLHARAKPAALDRDILRLAADFARALGGALHAVHALQPAAVPFPLPALNPDAILELQQRSLAKARAAVMAESLRALPSSPVPPDNLHVVAAPAAEGIGASARELGAGMVVMGAVSRSGMQRLLIGNTAERAIDQLPCDVLVVKPDGFGIHFPRRARGLDLRSIALALPY